MKIQPIIDRLKSASTTLGGRVAGSAEFGAELEETRLTLPCAFVMLESDEATDPDTFDATMQMLTEDFAVVVAVSNAADTRGQAAAESIDDVKTDLIDVMLGWSPDGDHNPFQYVRSNHVAFDRARLFHRFVFRTSGVISSI